LCSCAPDPISATTVPPSRPPDVETIASAAAAGYAGRWARAVAASEGEIAPWLVDGFAGADLQRAALRGVPAAVPAAAMIRAAREALGDGVRVVLVEEDPGLLSRVEDALRDAELGGRLRRASRVADAVAGEIVLVEAPFASVANGVADAIGGMPALVRLGPLGAKGLPWDALIPLAALPDADVLLRFPGEDFARQGRFPGPLADFPPHLRRVVEACSALLADPRHGWLFGWRDAHRSGGPAAALAAAAERLRDQVTGVYGDVERLAHAVRLENGDDPVHLLLATSDPARAAELDAAVAEAGAPPRASTRVRAGRSARSTSAASEANPPLAAAPPSPAKADSATPSAEGSFDPGPGEANPAAPQNVDPPTDAPDETSVLPPQDAEPQPLTVPATDAERQPEDGPPPVEPVDAESRVTVPRPELRVVPWDLPAEPPPPPRPESAALLDLFTAAPPADATPPPRAPDLRAVAVALHARHAGGSVPASQILADLADAGLTPEQARTALGMLKRAGRAVYRSLDKDGAEVEFSAAAPIEAPASAAPRSRKPRTPLPDLLGLFDDEAPAVAATEAAEAPELDPSPPPATEKKPRRRKSADG
jgi:hypothetical protein